METRPILLLLGLLAAAGVYAQAYTWTDENGVVHFSDRPHPGATPLELPESTAPRPPPTQGTTGASQDDSSDDDKDPREIYDSLEIVTPAAEETLWNIEATLNVTVALVPDLKPGHRVRAYIDGTPQMVNGTSFQLTEIYRGVHNLQVEVIDPNGQTMIRSRPNRFYVQQNSIF